MHLINNNTVEPRLTSVSGAKALVENMVKQGIEHFKHNIVLGTHY